MNRILTVIVTVIVCAAVAAAAYYFVIQKNNASFIQSTSPNILYLTNPVTSFSGTIENISGNTITVSSDMILAQPLPLGPAQTTSQPQTKKITYQVVVTDKTFINQSNADVPYLFKQSAVAPLSASPSAAIANLSIRDLKTGQPVNINTNIDLRTLAGNQFNAIAITVSSNILTINGKITDISGNKINVTGFSYSSSIFTAIPGAQSNQEKQYTLTVDQNTEISGSIASNSPTAPSKSQKFSLSDLKKDQSVTIYADQKLLALRIIPLILNALPGLPPQSTPSATPAPK